jgi:hypothetical protein
MKVYRQKSRSDVELNSSECKPGLIVWVDGEENHRVMRVCAPDGVLLTLDQHRKKKAELAERNQKDNFPSRRYTSRWRRKDRHTFAIV